MSERDARRSPEEIELELTGMAHGGSAVGRYEGRAVFVPYGIPGERVRARLTADKKRFAAAEITAVLTASPQRIRPVCQHFGRCGGCHWQHISYEAQLDYKRQIVSDQLRRIGGLADVPVHPLIPSPTPWAYRTHSTFQAAADGRLGFVAADDRTIVPIEVCHIIRPELVSLFERLSQQTFPPGTRARLQAGSDGGWLAAIGDSGDDTEAVFYRIKGQLFRVSAGCFFQVNLPLAERLVELVLDRLALTGSQTVLDLYAGVGLFTAFLAARAARVTAIESYPPAVRDAAVNLAAFPHITLVTGAVEDHLPALAGPFDAAVIDPPRAGMQPRALAALIDQQPATIVYVSCDPATLARDAKALAGAGYRLHDIQPVDMFPQTYHIECVAHFVRV